MTESAVAFSQHPTFPLMPSGLRSIDMSNFRDIAPAPPLIPGLPASSHEPASDSMEKPGGRKRSRHTKEEWNELRDAIVQTYADHTLAETIQIIKERCGFEAS